jgi:polysaccharide export outer membrane protein
VKKLTPALLWICCLAAVLLSITSLSLAADQVPAIANESSQSGLLPVADPNYRLKEEDVLRLDVWGEPQLTNQQLQITPDGNINVAFVGEMQAAGLTLTELSKKIAQKLEEAGILANAKIQLSIISLHKPTVRVLGQVQRPGEVTFKEGDTILDAIAQAGSYTNEAWLEKATLTRKGSDKPIPLNLKKLLEGDLTENYELQKGDTIYIPPEHYENKVYVLGMVARPGIYPIKDRTTVLSAISLAGGPLERAAMRSTVVVRGGPSKPERVPCNIARLVDKGDFSQDIPLQPGDVVIVPETKRPDWGKISQVLSTILNLTYLRRYGLF